MSSHPAGWSKRAGVPAGTTALGDVLGQEAMADLRRVLGVVRARAVPQDGKAGSEDDSNKLSREVHPSSVPVAVEDQRGCQRAGRVHRAAAGHRASGNEDGVEGGARRERRDVAMARAHERGRVLYQHECEAHEHFPAKQLRAICVRSRVHAARRSIADVGARKQQRLQQRSDQRAQQLHQRIGRADRPLDVAGAGGGERRRRVQVAARQVPGRILQCSKAAGDGERVIGASANELE
mmetsp:Transcript_29835/g.88324  ORF Transcript_29835/g.88324 Transcript_29835/m.88324 type:complete len:237 (+) Transcript_29835:805-1515(+)